MISLFPSHIRLATLLLFSAFVVSGCSSSNSSNSQTTSGTTEGTTDSANANTDGTGGDTGGAGSTDSGTASGGDGPLVSVTASLELVADKTFSISWQSATGAQFYRVLENADGVSGFSPISTDLEASATQFDHRVTLYDKVNARYIVQACNADVCVDSDELAVSGTLASAVGYFKASNADAEDFFGDAISFSADGKTLAVGAPYEASSATRTNRDQENNAAESAGAVYVFVRVNGAWQQQAYIKASNTDSQDNFGEAVSLSADGNTLAVGARREDGGSSGVNGNQNDDSIEDAGAVYVLVRNGDNWEQQAYVKASNPGADDWFGGALALSADGNTLAIAASSEHGGATGINGNQNNDITNSGAVYVFVRNGATWQQQAYVKASNTALGNSFGQSVSLSADGNTMAVGADGENGASPGVNGDQNNSFLSQSGAAYVFVRSGSNWQQQAYVKASNPQSGDMFGFVVGLSPDGNTLAVGAIWEDSSSPSVNGDQSDNAEMESGAVYVYRRSSAIWQQEAYLKSSMPGSFDMFGYSVSLSTNGDILAVGSFRESSSATGVNSDQNNDAASEAGAAYLFKYVNGGWEQQAYLKASNTQTAQYFGRAVSMSSNGDTLAVGAPYESGAGKGINGDQSDHSAKASGAVYLY